MWEGTGVSARSKTILMCGNYKITATSRKSDVLGQHDITNEKNHRSAYQAGAEELGGGEGDVQTPNVTRLSCHPIFCTGPRKVTVTHWTQRRKVF